MPRTESRLHEPRFRALHWAAVAATQADRITQAGGQLSPVQRQQLLAHLAEAREHGITDDEIADYRRSNLYG
ncbi:hypothetical protein ACFXD5_11995 [Streptomyces sp. NPDC059385]|uniref:hypothetical protein n=1 Tax=Streptomyces sp. NPDC059385 TaxID=3346817 RepID=UPI00367BCBE2